MNIKISYQPQDLAPPHAYAAVLDLSIVSDEISINFELEYLGRDECSDEELKSEGFTRQDDFSWSGELNNAWKADLEKLAILQTKEEPDTDIYYHLEINGKKHGFPVDIQFANHLFQELLQGILEAAKIEEPLIIQLFMDNRISELIWSFIERTIHINQESFKAWEIGRDILTFIYSMNFDDLKTNKKPINTSINLGDGVWYSVAKDKSIKLKSMIDALTK